MHMFVEAGAGVVFNYRQAHDRARKLVQECGAERCLAVPLELEGTAGARELIAATVQRFGQLDLLVANHGIWEAQDVPINEMKDEQWARTMATNLDSVFAVVKYAVEQMKAQMGKGREERPTLNGVKRGGIAVTGSAGRIVLISSTAGQRGEAYHCDYAASKGALISMTKGLATELAPDRIAVNCVAPGWIGTDMSAPVLNDPGMRDRIRQAIPLGRTGTPEEVAAPVLFLCTEHAGFITGEIFNVNGGAVLVG